MVIGGGRFLVSEVPLYSSFGSLHQEYIPTRGRAMQVSLALSRGPRRARPRLLSSELPYTTTRGGPIQASLSRCLSLTLSPSLRLSHSLSLSLSLSLSHSLSPSRSLSLSRPKAGLPTTRGGPTLVNGAASRWRGRGECRGGTPRGRRERPATPPSAVL